MARTLSPEKRATLLRTALSLFVAQGVEHTSTAAIAKAADMAAGTLFLYFPTKQDLINTLVLQIASEQSAYITTLLKAPFSARETFYTIWRGSIQWFLEHLEAYRYAQQVRDSHLVGDDIVQETNRSFGYYHDAIQKGLAEGAIKPYPSDLIGSFLYQAIVAVMNLVQAVPDPEHRSEYIELGFEIFWNGIRTGRPGSMSC